MTPKPDRIGILALQGDFLAHASSLERYGKDYLLVKNPEQLDEIAGLIIPGGESTTIRRLAKENGLWERLKTFSKPILATCAGIILLAKRISNTQYPGTGTEEGLDRLDVTIQRNAFGSQINSFVATGFFLPEQRQIEMVFIRAPKIMHVGPKVSVIATCHDPYGQEDVPVGVRQGNIIGLTFHPELSSDPVFLRAFLDLATEKAQKN